LQNIPAKPSYRESKQKTGLAITIVHFTSASMNPPNTFSRSVISEAAWNAVSSRFELPNYACMIATGGPIQWVKQLLSAGTKKGKARKLGILFTFWWMI
jgi:hypothetical protein